MKTSIKFVLAGKAVSVALFLTSMCDGYMHAAAADMPDYNARKKDSSERVGYAVWYRVLDDESVVIACLAHRQDSDLVERRARLD